jgi:hypothetical protein
MKSLFNCIVASISLLTILVIASCSKELDPISGYDYTLNINGIEFKNYAYVDSIVGTVTLRYYTYDDATQTYQIDSMHSNTSNMLQVSNDYKLSLSPPSKAEKIKINLKFVVYGIGNGNVSITTNSLKFNYKSQNVGSEQDITYEKVKVLDEPKNRFEFFSIPEMTYTIPR